MIISLLKLGNFRNYEKKEFELEQKTVIEGGNGSGKTNILEAIYMLATGKSFRADDDSELVRYGEQYASVQGAVNSVQLRIFYNDRKRFEVNGVARRMMDFVGNLRAVLFRPEDIQIIIGSPSVRRKYLDFVISQKDREYRRSLQSYEKGLRQRNRLLDLIKEGVANRTQLWFWDRLLIKEGEQVTQKRQDFLSNFNIQNSVFNVQYDRSVISEMRLKQYEKEEVLAGSTLVGPHRDDFVVNMEGKDISKFGSRGQQRMAILALKIFELKYLTFDHLSFNQGESNLPVLLLDDVFSELDHKHRDEVLKIVDQHAKQGGQVIMTTADEHLVPEDWNIIRL